MQLTPSDMDAEVREYAADDDPVAVHFAQCGLKRGLKEHAVSWFFDDVFIVAWRAALSTSNLFTR